MESPALAFTNPEIAHTEHAGCVMEGWKDVRGRQGSIMLLAQRANTAAREIPKAFFVSDVIKDVGCYARTHACTHDGCVC